MKPVYQTIFDPENGNCFTACLASILETDIENVPNFHAMYENGYMSHVIPWLADRGYSLLAFRTTNVNGSAIIMGSQGLHVIAGYDSPNHVGVLHAVVAKVDNEARHKIRVVHDPAGERGKPVREQDGPKVVVIIMPRLASKYSGWVNHLKDLHAAREYDGHPALRADVKPDVRPFHWRASKLKFKGKDEDDPVRTIPLGNVMRKADEV
jgi:hypothetical protein